jgi:hypothetical protein
MHLAGPTVCPYNVGDMKRLPVITLIVIISCLVGCKKSSQASPNSSKSGDAIQAKLQELAGADATDCGRLKSQDSTVVQTASDCAMKAADSKHPFYVAYELPGLTTAVAGNSQGNLFAIQAQTSADAGAAVESTPCPAALRIAQSGRVTCYAPGSMNGMSPGASPHGGTPGTQSPHGGMPSATGQNSHGEPAAPSHGKPTIPK